MTSAEPPVLRGTSLGVRAGMASHVGRVRDHNEDQVAAEGMVFAVADGMGGHAAGEVASRIAVDTLRELVVRAAEGPDDVIRALAEANRRILATQQETPAYRGMGTTVAGITVVDAGGSEHWLVFNIGDSRVYRLADDRMTLLTRDHSEVRELVDAGVINAVEAARHPLRHVITRALGSDPAPVPDIWVLPPSPGERFVICSDGLSGEIDDDEIMRLAGTDPDPQAVAERLVAAAVEAGGGDNVSVVVVSVSASAGDTSAGAATRGDSRR
ncbi:MAG: PP2C family protein-serine/threonine phosphatase [Dermatophilaceae bacterium]